MVRIVCDFCQDCYRYGDGCTGSESFPEDCCMTSRENILGMMSDEEFYEMLDDIVSNMAPEEIIEIPGVREILSQHFDKQICDRWLVEYLERYL